MAGKFRPIFALVMAIGLAAPVQAKDVTLDDFLLLESAGGASVSPDGRTIVYRRTKVDTKADRYDSDLWVMASDGTGARLLSDAWAPAWLPDGRLSYLIDGEKGPKLVVRRLTGPDPKDAGEETPIAIDGPAPSGIKWSKDGRSFAFVSSVQRTDNPWPIPMPEGPEGTKWGPPPTVISALQYRVGVDQYRGSDRHIFIVPASGGKPQQLTSGKWNVGAYYSGTNFGTSIEWTPDSRAIVFEGLAEEKDDLLSTQQSRINRVDIATGTITALSNEPGFWRLPRVSPDGTLIAYTGNAVTGAAFESQQLRIMNSDGSGDRVLLADMPDRIFQYEWSADGDTLLVSMNTQGATELWQVDLKGKVRILAKGKHRFYLSGSTTGKAIGTIVSQQRDGEIGAIDLRDGSVRQLTDHGSYAANLTLAKSEELWATSADGTRVQGWLYRPANMSPETKYPLILDIHGGPDAMAGHDFDFRYHDFASRGYLVATSNPGGSTGYGAAFANRIQGGFPGTKDLEDLEAFLDRVIASGQVDTSRVFVMGCSGGGSLTAWLAAKTRRFAAATVMCPVTDWISMAGTTDVTSWTYTRFSRPFWEAPRDWLAHSPIMEAGKIDIPVLIANGARDQRTPVSQAAELYTALKVRGVPTRLLVFPNEGHGPWRSTPSNLLRMQLYVDEWFKTLGRPGLTADSPTEPGLSASAVPGNP